MNREMLNQFVSVTASLLKKGGKVSILNPGEHTHESFAQYVGTPTQERPLIGTYQFIIPRYPCQDFDEGLVIKTTENGTFKINYYEVKIDTLNEVFVENGFSPLVKREFLVSDNVPAEFQDEIKHFNDLQTIVHFEATLLK